MQPVVLKVQQSVVKHTEGLIFSYRLGIICLDIVLLQGSTYIMRSVSSLNPVIHKLKMVGNLWQRESDRTKEAELNCESRAAVCSAHASYLVVNLTKKAAVASIF